MRTPALTLFPLAAWPVPGAVPLRSLPAPVLEAIHRQVLAPPKPAVTREVMARAQFSMIGPDLPWHHNV